MKPLKPESSSRSAGFLSDRAEATRPSFAELTSGHSGLGFVFGLRVSALTLGQSRRGMWFEVSRVRLL